MARRTKYTPELVKRLTDAIALGATYRLACQYAGISERQFYTWQRQKPQFLQAIKEAEGRGALGWLAKIERAAEEGTWQAAAWKLERRYPAEYGRRLLEHQGAGGGPIRLRWDDGADTDTDTDTDAHAAAAASVSVSTTNTTNTTATTTTTDDDANDDSAAPAPSRPA